MSQFFVENSAGPMPPGTVGFLTGNSGGAVPPTANNIFILAEAVAAGTTPATVVGSPGTSTLEIEIQTSQAIASTNASNIGLAAFNSTQFTVDANGFVSLVGSAAAIEKINLQTGTSPIVPTAGAITFNGAVAAAGTNPVRTDGTGANTMALEVQISQAIASTDATKIGLSNFNSSFFTVDANGFVSLNGSAVGETITGNTGGALSPTAGNWNILGISTAAGTTPVQTAGSGSTLTVQIQKSQAIASTNATNVGLAAFNSAQFSVDANGFVSFVNASGMPWTDVTTATQALSVNNGYFTDRSAGVTYTLPATATLGDVIKIDGKLGITTVAQNANQAIRMSGSISTTGVGGSIVGTNVGDCVTLRCSTAGASTIWIAENFVGSWTVT